MPRLIDAEEPSKMTIVASQFKKNPLLKNPVSINREHVVGHLQVAQ